MMDDVSGEQSKPVSPGLETGKTKQQDRRPILSDEAAKPDFKTRYQTLQLKIKTIQEEVSVTALKSTIVVSPQEGQKPTLAETEDQVNKLNQRNDLTSSQYLTDSQSIINKSIFLKSEYHGQTINIDKKLLQLNIQMSETSRKLSEISRKSGWKRTMLFFEKRELIKNKEKLQKEIGALENQKITVQAKITELNRITEPIIKKRQQSLLDEVKKGFTDIREEYSTFINEVLQNKQILTEIREVYIKNFLLPELEQFEIMRKKQKRPIKAGEKQEFLDSYKTCFDLEEIPDEDQRLLTRKKLTKLTHDRFSDLVPEINETVLARSDTHFLRKFINHLAARDFLTCSTVLAENLKPVEINFSQISEIADEVKNRFEDIKLGLQIEDSQIKELNLEKEAESDESIKWLKTMTESEILTNCFGNQLKEIDNKIYEICLDKSLNDEDGPYIESLKYYPTPESIRNIVLLAAADSRSHRTVHANCVLTALAQRKDWPQILDKVEEKYPTLKKNRRLLLDWHYIEHVNMSNIQEIFTDFTHIIYTETEPNSNLAAISAEALANSSALDILADKGLITEYESSSIKEASEKVLQIKSKPPSFLEKNRHINDKVHRICRQLINKNQQINDKTFKDNINSLKQLAVLGHEILETKNAKIINILTSGSAVKIISNCQLPLEKSSLFIKSLVNFIDEGILSVDSASDLLLGKGMFRSVDKEQDAIQLVVGLISKQVDEIATKIKSENSTIMIDDENWKVLLSTYALIQANYLPLLSDETKNIVLKLFETDNAKDFCLDKLSSLWFNYLNTGSPGITPFTLLVVPEMINYSHGIGPLSQIESLGLMIRTVNQVNVQPESAEITKREMFTGLGQIENRFINEKWSNEDKADFYNISRDIINTSPSIFSDFLNLFDKLNPVEIRRFSKELYPLYRAKLAMMEKIDPQTGTKTFTKEQLITLRKDVRSLTESLRTVDKPFEAQKAKILEEIKSVFQGRFGIIKIPSDFTNEETRAFINVSMYLGNLHKRNPEKENILGFYLAMKINGRWDDLRKGVEIDPAEYLIPEKSQEIKRLLSQRQLLNPLSPKALDLTPEEMPEFNRLLQQETSSIAVGSIETIDVKLNNVISNLKELGDIDIYKEELDKQRMKLLIDFGYNKVGKVIAQLYRSLTSSEKQFQFNEEETKIKNEIEKIVNDNDLKLNSDTIKKYFQDGLRPFTTVVNLLQFVNDSQAEQEIASLRKLLQPGSKIIEVFNRLGEEFHPGSGAQALSQDLNYLNNLVVKRADELKPEEIILLNQYITNIRLQTTKLQVIYDQVKNKFISMKQGNKTTKNDQLKSKLEEIEKIINTEAAQQTITSIVTNDLNSLIENMRACLSCDREGGNNDTNLTFGDMNKFYLFSQLELGKKGSLSDQIIFVEPIIHQDGKQEISFVLDKIYGTNTPTILISQIEAVVKKYKMIKEKFPNIKLSVFVSDSAILGNLSPDSLIIALKEKKIIGQIENKVEVNIVESAAGDHYIDLDEVHRKSGKRLVNGVIIR